MRILIVEDDSTAGMLMQIYLRKLGRCNLVVNGVEAVKAVSKSYADQDPYDLICLDIMMPEMDGIEALEKIREIEKEQGIEGLSCSKVIITTAKDQPNDIFGAFRTGCESYIVKPVRKQELIREIQKLGLMLEQGQD